MTIEIHEPELEALIQRRMESGRFGSVEEALLEALRTSPGVKEEPKEQAAIRSKNFVDLFEPIRGLFADGELDFSRRTDFSRPVDFS